MRALLVTLVAALPLTAQSAAAVGIHVDVSPPPSDAPEEGVWVQGLGNGIDGQIVNFRIRADGVEGGWAHPLLCVQTNWDDLPDWLHLGASCQASALTWHGAVLPPTDPDPVVWRQNNCQRFVDLTFFNGYPTPQTDGVKWWCQPLLTPQPNQFGLHASSRVWHSSPPLWTGSVGQLHRSQWMGLLADPLQGSTPPRMTCYSGGAALRQAMLMQSLMVTGSMASAIQFLNSDNFRYAVSQGWLTLVIQIFAARAGAELLGEGNWEEDDEVPDLGSYSPPPAVGVSPASRWVVTWPQHSGALVQGFANPSVVPGSMMVFRSDYATPPVMLEFLTTTGRALRYARATPNLSRPGYYSVAVPENLVAGGVRYKGGLDPTFVQVGSVTPMVIP